jgi:hypothetical protein
MPSTLDRALGQIRAADLHAHPVLAAWPGTGRDGVSPGRILHLAAARPPSLGGWTSLEQDAVIVAAVIIAALAYYFSLRIWPYGPCLRCIGHAGKNRGSNRRRWGRCKRCGGSGQRIRLGARLLHTVKDGGR